MKHEFVEKYSENKDPLDIRMHTIKDENLRRYFLHQNQPFSANVKDKIKEYAEVAYQ